MGVVVSYSRLVVEAGTGAVDLVEIVDVLVGSADGIAVVEAAAEIAETVAVETAAAEGLLLVHGDCIWADLACMRIHSVAVEGAVTVA